MGKVKQKNRIRRNLILRALLDHGTLSFSDLKNITGISLPVVISLVQSLKEEGMLLDVEQEYHSQVGRPPSQVRLKGEAGYILGIDIGRVNTNFVLLDLAQNIVADERRKSVKLSNDPAIVNTLHQEIQDILGGAGVDWDRVLGLGVSLPGIVQGVRGMSHSYFNFEEGPLRQVLTERFGKPVHIEHDVKAMALGELWFGGAKGRRNVLCVNVGWGLGMGIISNGRVYYGNDGYAGEFGHLQVEPNGNPCYCGNQGCLETYASGQSIAAAAAAAMMAGESTALHEVCRNRPEGPDAKMIVEAAAGGDELCKTIIVNAAQKLGYGLGQVINLFNPELIILGGRISRAEFFFNTAVEAARRYSMDHVNDNVAFALSRLGHRSGALGVGVLAARDLFEVEHLNPKAFV
ncbi:ROK family transcriptional regulator [bacterium]|nr:ROK family transcriptional regulator [bacterium]